MPDVEGQLRNFTDVYHIDIRNHCNLLSTLQPILKGVHVNDNHICIPHDVIVGRQNELVLSKDDTKANYLLLQKIFVDELTKSKSNKAGCKRYVTGSFIAYPETFVQNPLVVDSYLISNDKQFLIQVQEDSLSPVIGTQSSIRIQHIEGVEYCKIRESALRLGKKVASLRGKNSVRDKPISDSVCIKIGLPSGFDGPMHPLGIHIDRYNRNQADPVHYGGTKDMITEITDFANLCIPTLKSRFHWECLVLQ